MHKIKLSKKQKSRLKEYSLGDVISIYIKAYAKLYNRYSRKITSDALKRKIYSKEKINEHIKNKKFTRPVIVIWNNQYSNFMILSSLTHSKHKFLNYEIKEGSYANYEVLLLNKSKWPISYDGKIFDSINQKKVDEFLIAFKKQRPKSYLILMETINRYQKEANEAEICQKNKLIEELLKNK